MRATTVDPMTGNEVTDTGNAPFVVEGEGDDALKLYFESEVSQREYIEFSADSDDSMLIEIYNGVRGNETMGTIN